MSRYLMLALAMLWLLAACTAPAVSPVGSPAPTEETPVTIQFAARVNESPAECGGSFRNVGLAKSTISFSDFRFYVSDVRLINDQGAEVPVTLTQDGLWQVENIALLDFENATGACGEAGTEAMNNQIVGTVPGGTYNGIVFTLGVPFAQNHLDTTTAPSPLNVSALWWNWQAGYIFLAVEGMWRNSSGALDGWSFHFARDTNRTLITLAAPLAFSHGQAARVARNTMSSSPVSVAFHWA